MKKCILKAAVVLGSAATFLYAEAMDGTVRLRDLDISGLSVDRDNLTLTATFDVKQAPIMGEVVLDFYLLLTPQNNDIKPQFLHCRTVHRYVEEKSGLKSGVVLDAAAIECIEPRKEQYAVVITYKGKEAGVENSEKGRWWEDAKLGAPIENMLRRFAQVPIVRVWESGE